MTGLSSDHMIALYFHPRLGCGPVVPRRTSGLVGRSTTGQEDYWVVVLGTVGLLDGTPRLCQWLGSHTSLLLRLDEKNFCLCLHLSNLNFVINNVASRIFFPFLVLLLRCFRHSRSLTSSQIYHSRYFISVAVFLSSPPDTTACKKAYMRKKVSSSLWARIL